MALSPSSLEGAVQTTTSWPDDSRQIAKPTNCYPGRDVTSSTRIFLSLYEEEEACEEPEWLEDHELSGICPADLRYGTRLETMHRPTIYFVSRIFDSIKGFHKGSLDLSGRHPERYYQLQRQWNRFLWGLLSLETAGEPSQFLNLLGVAEARHERWHRFLMKWRLPESTSYNQLITCIQSVIRVLKQQPVPLFQMTLLTDLPSEILDNILDMASPAQAKALSSTCHQLNDIGQRHIFQNWRLKLHVPPHINPFNVEYSSIDLPTLAQYSRMDLEKSAAFVLSSPHISHRIKNLTLTDEWCVSRRAHPHEHNPFKLGMEFNTSITRIFTSVLRAATNVSTLVLCNLEISVDLIRRIGENHSIHTLEFHHCHIPRLVRRRLTSDPFFICSRIANLRIYMDSSFPETHSQWYSILLCPNARTLSVVQFGTGPFPAPDSLFWLRCRLDNLERLALDNVDAGDLAQLIKFFGFSKKASMHLTHFKLHMDWGISDAEALTLLFALHAAPLEVLVLEGLAEADFALFEHIAHAFPQVRALTLVRRENGSQRHNKLARWPHAAWEYASRLAACRSLIHFCWNFRTEYWDATPSTLLAFEADFAPPAPAAASPAAHLDFDLTDDAPPYFLDSHWMALPFAAQCPALQSFALMDRTVDMVCRIYRHAATGATKLMPKYYPTHSFVSWNVQQWNTVGSHWPSLAPSAKAGIS